jgi:predicted Zn-dependent protease
MVVASQLKNLFMDICRYVLMKAAAPLIIIVLVVMTVFAIAVPAIADDCGCSDTGGSRSSDTGSDSSGFGGDSTGDNAMLLVIEGRILFGEGRYNESLTAYRSALVIDPNDASALSGTADVLYALGNYTDAVDAYDRLIRLDPADDAAWYKKGNAYLAIGKYQNAVGAYDRALAMNPGIADAKTNRGIALAKIEAAGSPQNAVTPVISTTTEVTSVSITQITTDTSSIPEFPTGTMRSGALPVTALAAFCITCGFWIMMSSLKR